MNRRNFIASGTVVAIATSMLPTVSCKNAVEKQSLLNNETGDDTFELNETTIDLLQDLMHSGKKNSEMITQMYLDRIHAIDKNGPVLNSIIELNPEAINIAKALDEERKNGRIRSALHGIPVLIKDNINTADKMKTSAGSLALKDNIATQDAFIVKKLRDAGAVILGKTNLSEWANFRSSHSCSGWSSRGGQTKNPYFLDKSPLGSSAGSGAAVAANLCAVAIGTETDGSITCPASANGIVGIKPTVGLLSRSGIIPISFTQDTAGPLARTVTDAALLLAVMIGEDASDEKSKLSKQNKILDYTPFLKADGLNGKRIGIEKKKYENQIIQRFFEKSLDILKAQGATIVEIEFQEKFNALSDAELDVLKYEFKDGLNKYLATTNNANKTLADLITYNLKHEDEIMPTFRQDIFESCEKLGGTDSKEYLIALEKSNIGSQKIIDALLQEKNLNAICGITLGPACSIDTIYGDRFDDISLTSPAAMSGYPHISVPAGNVYEGLPVGISFFSGAFTEAELIEMAYAFEQAGKQRKIPSFKRTF